MESGEVGYIPIAMDGSHQGDDTSTGSTSPATENELLPTVSSKTEKRPPPKKDKSAQPPKKRNKPSLVCSNCKRRKIKCDRRLPCSSCVKMKCGYECNYEPKWQSIAFNSKDLKSLQQQQHALHVQVSANGSKHSNNPEPTPQVAAKAQRDSSIASDTTTTGTSGIWKSKGDLFPAMPPETVRQSSIDKAHPLLLDLFLDEESNATDLHSNTSSSAVNKLPESPTLFPDLSSKDPTFGYNPIESVDDTINFYENYTPFHVKEPLRRINHGPLSWPAFMRKDPWLLVLWIYSTGERNGFPYLLFTGGNEVTKEKLNDLNAEDQEVNPGGNNNNVVVDTAFKKKALQLDGYEEVAPIKSIINPSISSSTTTATTNSSRVTQDPVAHKDVIKTISSSYPKPSAFFADGTSFNLDTANDKGKKVNKSLVTLGKSLLQGKVNPDIELVEQVKAILPKKKVLWNLLEEFFDTLYPFMPFLDESDFKEKIANVIGPELFEDEYVEHVKVHNKLDLANLAILLIVLRLTYVSLFDNKTAVNEKLMVSTDPDPKIQRHKYLMNNTINLSVVDTAKLCLNRFEITRKTNMTIFQCFFFIRIYNIYAPEEGDGHDGGDSRVLTGMLIQMAYSLGLNREPDNFADVFNDERVNLLGRKMWYFLVREDIVLCISIGNMSVITPKHFDTKAPFYKEGNANVSKIDMELAIIQMYKWFNARSDHIRNVVDMITDIRGNIKLKDVTDVIEYFEKEANTKDVFDKQGLESETMMRVYLAMRLKIYLFLKSSLISLNYHIYLYYEDKLNYELSFYYLKKMCSITLYYILPVTFDILCGKHSKCSLALNPSLQLALHKANQVNIAAGVRVGYLVYNLESMLDHYTKFSSDDNYKRHFLNLESAFRAFIRCGELLSATLGKLALKYYYAWRILKAHAYLFHILTTKEFYQNLPNNVKKMRSFQFTSPQLEELTKIAKSTVRGLEQILNFDDVQATPIFSISSHGSVSDSPPIINQHRFSNQGMPVGTGGKGNNEKNTTSSKNMKPDISIDSNGKVLSDIPTQNELNYGQPYNFLASSFPSEDVDQMWLLVLAMKYNSGSEYQMPINNNTATVHCTNNSSDFDQGADLNNNILNQYNYPNNFKQPVHLNSIPQAQQQTQQYQQQHPIGNFISSTIPSLENQFMQHQIQQQNLVLFFENEFNLDVIANPFQNQQFQNQQNHQQQ